MLDTGSDSGDYYPLVDGSDEPTGWGPWAVGLVQGFFQVIARNELLDQVLKELDSSAADPAASDGGRSKRKHVRWADRVVDQQPGASDEGSIVNGQPDVLELEADLLGGQSTEENAPVPTSAADHPTSTSAPIADSATAPASATGRESNVVTEQPQPQEERPSNKGCEESLNRMLDFCCCVIQSKECINSCTCLVCVGVTFGTGAGWTACYATSCPNNLVGLAAQCCADGFFPNLPAAAATYQYGCMGVVNTDLPVLVAWGIYGCSKSCCCGDDGPRSGGREYGMGY